MRVKIVRFVNKNTAEKQTNELGFPASTISGVVDRLVEKGFAERDRSEKDRRVVIIGLGKNFLARKEEITKKYINMFNK